MSYFDYEEEADGPRFEKEARRQKQNLKKEIERALDDAANNYGDFPGFEDLSDDTPVAIVYSTETPKRNNK